MYKAAVILALSLASASAFAPSSLPSLSLKRNAIAPASGMRRSTLGLRMQLSEEERAAAQSVGSEAAWEAAQKQAAQSGGIASDFNPYDPDTGYWLGEWICADCGYIYGSRGEQQPFETLGRWYKCPQCAGPRRRFAKKLGNKVGGADGDKAILYSTLIGLAAIVGAFILALQISAF